MLNTREENLRVTEFHIGGKTKGGPRRMGRCRRLEKSGLRKKGGESRREGDNCVIELGKLARE